MHCAIFEYSTKNLWVLNLKIFTESNNLKKTAENSEDNAEMMQKKLKI